MLAGSVTASGSLYPGGPGPEVPCSIIESKKGTQVFPRANFPTPLVSFHSKAKDVNTKLEFLPVLIRKTRECMSVIYKILKF
jgi:hypothetical protein